jgi:hypothetical protein
MTTQEFLARPLKEVIRNVATAVAEGQADLDRSAVAVQRELDAAIERGELEYDLDASWFQFSEVETDVKVALSISGREERDDEGNVRGFKPVLEAYPYNPRLKNSYDFEVDATTDVGLSIVPVPAKDRR